MYNKLFTKILDSSVWLESVTTRIVWLTFIAAMDEDGFAAFAATGNLANRARVSLPQCEQAIKVLEAPDPQSADPDHDGRRIERVPGGWMVLNASKYRAMVTRVVAQERTRERVRKHRKSKAGNASVTVGNDPVTPSEAVTEAEAIDQDRAFGADEPIRTDDDKPKVKVLTAVARSFLKTADLSLPDSELSAQLKDMAAKMGLAYDGRSIQKAIDSARRLS